MTVRPWQVVALATLCFIQAFHLVEAVLGYLLSSANHANVVDWAELGAQDGDVNQIYETLALISDVYGLMAVVFLMFGILLYRGQYLSGVRLTGSITSAIMLVLLLIALLENAFGIPDTDLSTHGDDVLRVLFAALLLAGFVSLFFGKSANWVNEHRN